ncbi:MIP/aquaporin family protein [Nostocoides sp. HKS02]|uniref:aquaporin n=1 Tax=Nostocoides sp. HKS02 TaxID=1813880 RepID=UPI0012B44BD1|nr:MIP/aquaporin family protein [Tetrasphaera sp. HKS02]QGN58991.1 aquaporin family protein [Tetrasphaera sp. HKS02]
MLLKATPSARIGAEFLGTAGLVAAVVGSGVMAQRLTGDVAVQLLVNAVATVAVLGVLISSLGPVSGAHFNPAVTLAQAVRREHPWSDVAPYLAAQLAGGVAGTALANLMFGLPALYWSRHDRSGVGLWLGEAVATAGLVLAIALVREGGDRASLVIPAWILGAYFFTSSTSFANPAVTVARTLSDTFAGIAPASAPAFVLAQLVGAGAAVLVAAALVPRPAPQPDPHPDRIAS